MLLPGLLALPAHANGPVLDVTAQSAQPLSLTTWVDLLEDPGAKLTLADVQSPAVAERFEGHHPASAAFALGFTTSAY